MIRAFKDLSKTGQLEVLRILIKAGADVHAADLAGFQAIHVAAGHAHPELVRELLKAGADPNAPGRPEYDEAFVPLYDAVIFSPKPQPSETKERTETARILLEYGAHVNAYHPVRGDGPLQWAADSGLEVVVSLLLQRGAEIEHEDNDGNTGLTAGLASLR